MTPTEQTAAVIQRATELLESVSDTPCDNCDVSVGHICEECHYLQLICDLRNALTNQPSYNSALSDAARLLGEREAEMVLTLRKDETDD
jgi:hypothetical protein